MQCTDFSDLIHEPTSFLYVLYSGFVEKQCCYDVLYVIVIYQACYHEMMFGYYCYIILVQYIIHNGTLYTGTVITVGI